MDRDELREKIDRIVSRAESNSLAPEWQKSDYTAQILSLIAPVLADAEKWRVLEKKYPNFCKRFDVTIDALEGEEEKG